MMNDDTKKLLANILGVTGDMYAVKGGGDNTFTKNLMLMQQQEEKRKMEAEELFTGLALYDAKRESDLALHKKKKEFDESIKDVDSDDWKDAVKLYVAQDMYDKENFKDLPAMVEYVKELKGRKGNASAQKGKKYNVGDVVEKGGKKWEVTVAGDDNTAEVKEIK
jgi:hypothetical protein